MKILSIIYFYSATKNNLASNVRNRILISVLVAFVEKKVLLLRFGIFKKIDVVDFVAFESKKKVKKLFDQVDVMTVVNGPGCVSKV